MSKSRSKRFARYGLGRQAQASHRSGAEIALGDTEARGHKYPWDEPIAEPAYWVGGVRRRGGVSSIRAFPWSCGNSERDAKRKDQVKNSKVESIDARFEDGPPRMSVEALVMSAVRRGRVARVETGVNSLGRMGA